MMKFLKSPATSARFYGLSIAAVALVNLALGTFDPTQPVPDGFPARTALAYGTALLLLMAGVGIAWERTGASAAAVLTAYFAVIVAVMMNGAAIFTHPVEYGSFFGAIEGFALASASIIIFAANGKIDRATARPLCAPWWSFGANGRRPESSHSGNSSADCRHRVPSRRVTLLRY